jgi:hypothetical protein
MEQRQLSELIAERLGIRDLGPLEQKACVEAYNLAIENAMEAVYDNQKCYSADDLKIKQLTKQQN